MNVFFASSFFGSFNRQTQFTFRHLRAVFENLFNYVQLALSKCINTEVCKYQVSSNVEFEVKGSKIKIVN